MRRRYQNISVFFFAPLILVQIFWAAYLEPISLMLACIPLLYTVPIFLVLDRVEPEPRAAKIYAFLYGAFVATSIAGIANGLVGGLLGGSAAAVLSAPFVEEGLKLLGILWAYRKKLIDGPLDGVVYAAIIALGFASVENVMYFSEAASNNTLSATFILRGVLSPFSHPLFTMWTGVFLGKALVLRRRISNFVAMGLALSICLHLAWNLTAVLGGISSVILLISFPLFITLFAFSIHYIYKLRQDEETEMIKIVPEVVDEFGISHEKANIYGYFRHALEARKYLDRKQKKIFDQQRVAFSRLASIKAAQDKLRQNEVDQLVATINAL
jgi:RsiW-degrading membrane proteinase PrsW (M82 family)